MASTPPMRLSHSFECPPLLWMNRCLFSPFNSDWLGLDTHGLMAYLTEGQYLHSVLKNPHAGAKDSVQLVEYMSCML